MTARPANADRGGHTVEKIGGTSMSRTPELVDTIFGGDRPPQDRYGRIFVVSAYGGVTDLLLEHKKSGEAGVYARFTDTEDAYGWSAALTTVAERMRAINAAILDDPGDRRDADAFVRERIEGARNCLIDLERLCSYGHFQVAQHLLTVRELLAGLGEAHAAYGTVLVLRRRGINARFVDLSGWRDETHPSLDERLAGAFAEIDLTREMPVVTGYAQCREGLMRAFDRGYTEVTFARLAALTGAREAVIHKEFHLSSADPAIVGGDKVVKIGRTNYDVADQLSNMGMEAIHPQAAKTLRQAGIPLRVANAFDPSDPGTLIDAEPGERPGVEMVTGLAVTALELFEQDMLGVKGYDATILEHLTRHEIYIVTKSSNANTITHYCHAPLNKMRSLERDLSRVYPSARVTVRRVAIVSVIGRDLAGLRVSLNGLAALCEAGIEPIALHEGSRKVDVQFVVEAEARETAIRALHERLIERAAAGTPQLANAA